MDTPKKNPFSLQIDVSRFEKATEEEKRQQDVMMAIKKFHPDRTSAYISEQWERIKLNKI